MSIYPPLTGSKTPTFMFQGRQRKTSGSQLPVNVGFCLTNNQWGKNKKPPQVKVSLYTTLKDNRESLLMSAGKHGITSIKVFGSAARMEDNEASDVDFLVTFEDDRSLFDLIRFKNDAEKLLQRKVDVVTENAVHQDIRDEILSEAKPF